MLNDVIDTLNRPISRKGKDKEKIMQLHLLHKLSPVEAYIRSLTYSEQDSRTWNWAEYITGFFRKTIFSLVNDVDEHLNELTLTQVRQAMDYVHTFAWDIHSMDKRNTKAQIDISLITSNGVTTSFSINTTKLTAGMWMANAYELFSYVEKNGLSVMADRLPMDMAHVSVSSAPVIFEQAPVEKPEGGTRWVLKPVDELPPWEATEFALMGGDDYIDVAETGAMAVLDYLTENFERKVEATGKKWPGNPVIRDDAMAIVHQLSALHSMTLGAGDEPSIEDPRVGLLIYNLNDRTEITVRVTDTQTVVNFELHSDEKEKSSRRYTFKVSDKSLFPALVETR